MELGPLLRSMRHHKGAFSLLVLEVAFGYVILVHTLISARYYLRMHVGDTGLADGEMVVVTRRFLHAHDVEVARLQQRRELAALARLDGVSAAVGLDASPLPDSATFPLAVRDPDGGKPWAAWSVQATRDVVPALGLRLLAGRGLNALPEVDPHPGDHPADDALPLLVTSALARRLFGNEGAAVGRLIDSTSWRRGRVVGVVDNFTFRGTWLPHADHYVIVGNEPASEQELTYALRVNDPGRIPAVALAAHAALDAAPSGVGGSILTVAPLRRESARYMQLSRGATILLLWTGFLVVAVALSGSLALASFSVAERTRQIGVRRALGARRGEIISYFLLENLVLTGFGLALGIGLALGLNLVIRQLMAEIVMTADLAVIATVVFLVTGQLSALVPARRAAAIPPWAATRTL